MKNYPNYCLCILFSFCIACSNPSQKENKEESLKESTWKEGCFAYSQNGNRLFLQIEINEGKAKGFYMQGFVEKDVNHGNFTGKFFGDTLIADYNFTSEGIISDRQIFFLKNKDDIFTGFGQLNADGQYDQDRSGLQFIRNMPMKPVSCKENPYLIQELDLAWSSFLEGY